MRAPCPRALGLVFAIAGFLGAIPEPATACSRSKPHTDKILFGEAVHVFRAQVTRVELSGYRVRSDDPAMDGKRAVVHVSYELKEVLKGSPTLSGPVTTWTGYVGGCAVPVIVGLDYMFFVYAFSPDFPKAARDNSIGTISIFGTRQLPQNEDVAEEAMIELRGLTSGR